MAPPCFTWLGILQRSLLWLCMYYWYCTGRISTPTLQLHARDKTPVMEQTWFPVALHTQAWLPGSLKITCVWDVIAWEPSQGKFVLWCRGDCFCQKIYKKEYVCYDAVEQCSRECWRMAPGGWNGSSCNLYITRSEIGVMHKLCSTISASHGRSMWR